MIMLNKQSLLNKQHAVQCKQPRGLTPHLSPIARDSLQGIRQVGMGRRIALDVARGLHFLHSNKIVHFDLKSANILLARDNTAKIADVGLAKILHQQFLSSLYNVGTFAWSAPEVSSCLDFAVRLAASFLSDACYGSRVCMTSSLKAVCLASVCRLSAYCLPSFCLGLVCLLPAYRLASAYLWEGCLPFTCPMCMLYVVAGCLPSVCLQSAWVVCPLYAAVCRLSAKRLFWQSVPCLGRQ